MSDAAYPARFFPRLYRIGLAVGIPGTAAAALSAFVDPAYFFRGWLFGFEFWLGLTLGCIAILMFHYLMGGAWGVATRRIFEAGAMTLPLLALAFIPLMIGLPYIYEWAQARVVAADPLLLNKAAYLNPSFFLIRSVIYLALWTWLAWMYYSRARNQDKTDSPEPTRQLIVLSGPGLVLLILSGSFAWMDWLMSIEPKWYSSVYPIMVLAGQATSSMAFGVLIAATVAEDPAIGKTLTRERFHDLGTLLFTFVFFWAYLNFSQFIVIWAGNLKEEIPWYLVRISGGWEYVVVALFVLAFVVPFFLLLFRPIKRDRKQLRYIAALVFVMQMLNAYWLQAPPFQMTGPEFHWPYLAALLGIGGLWLAAFSWLIQQRPLLPLRAPEFPNVLPRPVAGSGPILAEGE
jgi:hypothetical protein